MITNDLLPIIDCRLSLQPNTSPLDPPPMTMDASRYKLETTLTYHKDSITNLQFSSNGEYLASGSDDGMILVYSTTSWKPIRRFVDVSPVSVLLWHNKARNILLCGHRSGDLHLVNVSKSTVRWHCRFCVSSPHHLYSRMPLLARLDFLAQFTPWRSPRLQMHSLLVMVTTFSS